MFLSDDPVKDFDRYDAEQEKKLERCPYCVECDRSVQDEHYYLFDDKIICPQCLLENHKQRTDEF